jgi:dienelactone hydrolase
MVAGASHRRAAAFVAAVATLLVSALVGACAPPPGPPYPDMPPGRFSTTVHGLDDLQVWWNEVYRVAVGVDGAIVPLAMDIAKPPGLTGPAPLVVVIHGGGFAAGSRADQHEATASYARRGYVAATIDYRVDPGASTSEERYRNAALTAIDDGMEAVRWLKAHAGLFRIDTTRIALVGSSAGGAIALGVGSMDDATPDGPLAAYDTDVAAAVATGATLTPIIGQDGVVFDPADAPALMFHHVVDDVTGYTAAYSYKTCEGLVAASVPCRFVSQPGRGHTVSVSADGPEFEHEIGPFLWAQLHLATVT